MPENPLLPHKQLQAVHALMVRTMALQRKAQSRNTGLEAVLSGTAVHLGPHDLFSEDAKHGLVQTLLTDTTSSKAPIPKPLIQGALLQDWDSSRRLPLCAAAARGIQAGGKDGLVLAFARAGTPERDWEAALRWAQDAQLPLLLVCGDTTEGARPKRASKKRPTLDFAAMTVLAKRILLPVLTVDGEDAVAVYRVAQECALRARMGGGPAVLWAVVRGADKNKISRRHSPLGRLEAYMRTRNIPFQPQPPRADRAR